jgi:hypothetical protein
MRSQRKFDRFCHVHSKNMYSIPLMFKLKGANNPLQKNCIVPSRNHESKNSYEFQF